ncbi:MAG: TerB family tellurite resistance protein [Pseudomonadota bacterium]
MLSKLKALFKNPEEDVPLTAEDEREALAALLVEAAHADGEYLNSEKVKIARILSQRFGLSPGEAMALRQQGEELHEHATDLVRFTQVLKKIVPHEDRIALIEAIWEIAYADGDRDDAESALVRKLCGLLYIPDRDAGLARQRVAKRLGHE